MRITALFWIYLLIVTQACNNKPVIFDAVDGCRAEVVASLDSYGEDVMIPISLVADVYENHLYALDRRNGHVFSVNEALEVQQIFGSKGNGPGEISGSNAVIYVEQDTVHVLEIGRRSVSIFARNGGFSRSLAINRPTVKMARTVDGFVFSHPEDEMPVSHTDLMGNLIQGFGVNRNRTGNPSFMPANHRTLFYRDGAVYAIPTAEPVLETYRLADGTLLNQDSLDVSENIRETFENIEKTLFNPQFAKEAASQNVTPVLFTSVQFMDAAVSVTKPLDNHRMIAYQFDWGDVQDHVKFARADTLVAPDSSMYMWAYKLGNSYVAFSMNAYRSASLSVILV